MTLEVVRVAGAPRRLGRAQGEALAPAIHASLGFYRELAASAGGDLDTMGAAGLPYLDAARTRAPEVVAELEGLVEGAGISLEEGLALNCFEEVWDVDACTTMVHGDLLMHAEQWYAGHSNVAVIVAEPDDGPAFMSPTCVGFLPAVGVSAAGFAVGIDSLTATDERIGAPRMFVARRSLGAPNLDEAVARAAMAGRAGGYAHVFAASGRRVAVETSATRHALVEDVDAHTNHYLSPQMQAVARPPSEGSIARLERARELLREQPPRSLDDCTRLLADHEATPQSICVHEDGLGATAIVFAMACDLATGRVLVSEGSPCRGRWHELSVPVARLRRVG